MEDKKFEALLKLLNELVSEIYSQSAIMDGILEEIRDQKFAASLGAPLTEAEHKKAKGVGLYHRAPSALDEEGI